MKTKIKLDFIVVLVMVVLAIPISFAIDAKFLTSTFLFFGIPSLYLLFRQKRQLKRIITGSILFGIFYGFLLDYVAEFNNAWAWASDEQLIFPYKIFGVVNIDVMIWFFFWVFFLIIFYEHFLEHDRKSTISPNIKPFW